VNIQSLREWVSSWGDGPNWSDASGATIPTAKATLLGLLDSIADITTARDKLAAECERLRALVNRAADSLDYCVQRHGEHSKSVRGDELRLAAIASEGGGEVSDEKTLDNKQLDMLRMIADTHHRTECASWKLLWLIDQHRALSTALATATTERDALGGEVEGLKADLGAAQATADDRFKWRHVVERETAEAIAAFVDTEAEARREEGFSYRAVSELAADIRSGSWKEPR